MANKTFLEQAESPISVISWHSGKLARVARSSNSAELQAAADAEGELSYIRLSLRELVGEPIPLQRWQEAAAQIPSALVLDSRGVHDALARSESACLGLKDKRSGLEALSLKHSLVETRCGLRWTHSAAQLADCMTKGSEKAQKPFELLKRRGWKWRLENDPSFTSAASEHRKDMTFWTICPHRVQRKSFQHTSRDSTKGDVKASVFCNVSARSRHFVNVDVIFLPSVCDSFCVSTFSLGQGCRSFCHELYEQSTVVFCRSRRDACFTIVCILCADHVFWYPWFLW